MRKIPTLFVRDFDHHHGRYVTREVTPGCDWVLAGEGVATRKVDGTCIKVENGRGMYALWARREIKAGKAAPDGFVEVEADETTGKRVGWEPWANSGFAAFIEEARQTWAREHPLPDAHLSDVPAGTYELCGPKINANPEGYAEHRFIRHGSVVVDDLYDRSFDGLLDWTTEHPSIEGIVFWRERGNPDAGMVKIKRRDFLRVGDV